MGTISYLIGWLLRIKGVKTSKLLRMVPGLYTSAIIIFKSFPSSALSSVLHCHYSKVLWATGHGRGHPASSSQAPVPSGCPKATSANLGKPCYTGWTNLGPLWNSSGKSPGGWQWATTHPGSVPLGRTVQIKDLLGGHAGLSEWTLEHPSETLEPWVSLPIRKPTGQSERKKGFPS